MSPSNLPPLELAEGALGVGDIDSEKYDISNVKRSVVHLFGDYGTTVAVNRFGELLQFNQPIIEAGETILATAEVRSIVAFDSKLSWEFVEAGAPTDSIDDILGEGKPKNLDGGDEEDEIEDDSVASDALSEYSLRYRGRVAKFSKLHMTPYSGFGLRLAPKYGKLVLRGTRFHEDRWPEIDYSAKKRDIKVNVRFLVEDSQLTQQFTLTNTGDAEDIEVDVDLDFRAAIRRGMHGKIQLIDYKLPDIEHSLTRDTRNQLYILTGPNQKMVIALFKDQHPIPPSTPDKFQISTQSTEDLFHRENVKLRPREAVIFTATYQIVDVDTKISVAVTKYLTFNTSTERWWRFKRGTRGSARTYRRSLAHIVDVLAQPLLGGSGYNGDSLWILLEADMVHWSSRAATVYEAVRFLLGMYKLLRDAKLADPVTSEYYMRRIHEILKGVFLWTMKYKPLKGWSDAVSIDREYVDSSNMEQSRTDIATETKTEIEESKPGVEKAQGKESETSTERIEGEPEKDKGTNKDADQEKEQEKEETYIHTDPCVVPYCLYIILLHEYAVLFPEDLSVVRECFEGHLRKFWKTILDERDAASGLWPYIYRSNVGGAKDFQLQTQITVWKAMDSIKRMGKLLAIPKDDNILQFEDIVNPQIFRERVFERFTVSSTFMVDGKHATKVRVLALERRGGRDEHEFVHTWYTDLLIPARVWNFFTKDDTATQTWNETVRHQRWPMPDVGEGTAPYPKSFWELTGKYIADIVLAENQSRASEDLIMARKQMDQYVARTFPGGIIYYFVNLRVVEEYHWECVAQMLCSDFAAEFDPKREETLARTQGALDQKGIQSPTEGKFAEGSDSRVPRQSADGNLLELVDSRRARGKPLEATLSTGDTRSQKYPKDHSSRRVAMGTRGKAERINETPDYGPAWLYLEPTFFLDPRFYRGFSLKNFEDVKIRLLTTFTAAWNRDLWGTKTDKDMKDYFERMTVESLSSTEDPKLGGGARNYMHQCGSKGSRAKIEFGPYLVDHLIKKRDIKTSKKRIFLLPQFTKSSVYTLLGTCDDWWVWELSRFIVNVKNCTTTLSFTTSPEGCISSWETQFILSYIEIVEPHHTTGLSSDELFSSRRSQFLSSSNAKGPPKNLRESSIGLIFSGDLHDRYWTCWVFYNKDHTPAFWETEYEIEYKFRSYQRRVIELLVVMDAMIRLIDNTELIIKEIQILTGPGNPDALFNQYNAEDGSGEHAFQNRYKHSVVFPWVLELLGRLGKKCTDAENILERVLNVEKEWTSKPRWSVKDEKLHGKAIDDATKELVSCRDRLKNLNSDLQDREQWVANMKEWIASDLALQDARRSVILSESARVFTVVSVIFLPLSFSSSIVAVGGFAWQSPVKDLFSIIAIVSAGTLLILINLDFFDQHFFSFVTRSHNFLRTMMVKNPYQQSEDEKAALLEAKDPEAGVPVVKPPSSGPPSKFWAKKAQNLSIMDSRKVMLGGQSSQIPETSDWWYWGFAFFFAIVKLPMSEVAFTVRHFWVSVKGVGPLQKLLRMPWIFLWILLLVIVYFFISLFGTISLIWKLIGMGFEYGWKGYLERPTTHESKSPIWKRSLDIMEFKLVQDAYRARKLPAAVAPKPARPGTATSDRKSSEAAEKGEGGLS